jgi:peptide deformylase
MKAIQKELGEGDDQTKEIEELAEKIEAAGMPELVKKEGSQIGYEGCLSYPGWVGEVERAETVVVKGRNRHGKEIRVKSSGFTARAFQHELDHLDGILFTDRLTSLDTLCRVEELMEEEREEAVAAASG